MAATGPAGPTTPQPSATATPLSATQTADRASPERLATQTQQGKTRALFNSPKIAQVTHSQPSAEATRTGQPLYGLTLQQGQTTLKVFSPQNYPVGTKLTLQSTPNGQLEIQNTGELKQKLMADHFQALNRLPAFPSSTSELKTPLTRIIHQLHALASTQTPSPTLLVKNLGELIQTLNQLNTLQIPVTKLDGPHVKDFILRSGLFLEHQLLQNALTERTGNLTTGTATNKPLTSHSDLKATLFQLAQQLNNVMDNVNTASTNTLGPTTTARAPNLPSLNNTDVVINSISNAGAKLLTESMLTNLKPTQPNHTADLSTYNAKLLTLLRTLATAPSGSNSAHPITANQAAALSVFFGFLTKLSQAHTHVPGTSATNSPTQTGWSALFSLLFPGPRRIPRSGDKGASTSLKQQLIQLISTTQSQLTTLNAKQLWLLNQKEAATEFKTLLAVDLPIQLPQEIQQTPLRLFQKDSTPSNAEADAEKTWKIELGFDLDQLGLIRTIALYRKGSLDLTFQTQFPQAKDVITTHLQALTVPLAKWGINLGSVNFSPYEEGDVATNYDAQSVLQKIIHIEL